jgi:hypothetical protein
MGLCAQIHDNIPDEWVQPPDKYFFIQEQIELIEMFSRLLNRDFKSISDDWRATEMICECIDLITEADEMKQHGRVLNITG